MRDIRTISMEGSEKLSWNDIDEHAKKHGFSTTSSFVQYLAEKEILGFKTKFKDIINYIILLAIMMLILLMLLLR